MNGMPVPVNERHKPFEKKSCARCLDEEFRIDGYCSIYCRDMAEVEDEVAQLEAENESLKGDSEMLQAMLEADYQAFLDLTEKVDEHIEGYERACLCAVCRSYGD